MNRPRAEAHGAYPPPSRSRQRLGGLSGAYNRTTETTHNGNSDVLTLKAVLPDGSDEGTDLDFQKTSYLYGVNSGTGVGGGNDLDSNDLLYAIAYPNTADGDSGSGSGAAYTTKFKYNALGQVKQTTDQNGTVHDYGFDVLGRLVSDAATTLGTFTRDDGEQDERTDSVDDAVRRLEYGYSTAGWAETFTSYSAASGGSVVNQVLRQYNGLGQVTAEYQEHGGAVVTGGGSPSPKVQYTYSEMSGGANHSRLTKVTYPNGRVLRYEYSAGLDTSISRVSFLADDNSGAVGTHLEEYGYLGLATIVERVRPQPGTKLTSVKQSGEANGEAGDQYAGLDRFGRVLDQRWYKSSTSSDLDRYGYGYDANSNRLYKENKVSTSRSELYAYDGLDRLVSLDRGTLSATKDSISGDTSFTADWTLDPLGNWDEYVADPNGSGGGTSPATQDRTHDFQNRLTGGAGANTPEHDAAGSMVEDEQGNEYNYDAWGRLVSYDAGGNGGTADVAYSYDALGRRIVEDPSDGDATDLYYSLGGQVLEERVGGTTKIQNVWGLGYVNQLVLRDRETPAEGTLDERLYVQQDANYNVTSVIVYNTLTSAWVVGERYTYLPYGKQKVLNGEIDTVNGDWTADDTLCGGAGDSDYLVTVGSQGGRRDTLTGDVHSGEGDLDVELGRWKTPGPTGYPDGMNGYEFVMSSPVSDQSLLFVAPAPVAPPPVAGGLALPPPAAVVYYFGLASYYGNQLSRRLSKDWLDWATPKHYPPLPPVLRPVPRVGPKPDIGFSDPLPDIFWWPPKPRLDPRPWPEEYPRPPRPRRPPTDPPQKPDCKEGPAPARGGWDLHDTIVRGLQKSIKGWRIVSPVAPPTEFDGRLPPLNRELFEVKTGYAWLGFPGWKRNPTFKVLAEDLGEQLTREQRVADYCGYIFQVYTDSERAAYGINREFWAPPLWNHAEVAAIL